jgi:hypothetical protein
MKKLQLFATSVIFAFSTIAAAQNEQTLQTPPLVIQKIDASKFDTWYKVPEEHRPKQAGTLAEILKDYPGVAVKGLLPNGPNTSQRILAYENPNGQPDGFGVWFCANLSNSNPNRVMFLRDSIGEDFLFYSYDSSAKWGNRVQRYSPPYLVRDASTYRTEFVFPNGDVVKSKYIFSPTQIKAEWINRPADRFPYIYKVLTRESCKDY